MGKPILFGIAVFLVVGIAMEYVLDSIFDPRTEAEFNATADRIIAAQREGEAIPAQPAEGERPGAPQIYNRPMDRGDCTAAAISPFKPHPPMEGTVLRVVDGDTIRVSVDGVEMPVRLWGIDAPEMRQARGADARRQLETMTPPDSRIRIHPLSMDQYGRVVGNVGEDSEWSVNFMMVAHGWAYHYKEFSARNNRCLTEAERIAKDSRIGVWSNGTEGGTRPWEYRRQEGNKPERTST